MSHLIKDNEYGEVWCDDGKADVTAYDVKDVTCSNCLLALIREAEVARDRLMVIGYKEIG